jgi:ABC-type branched-subunit amino acid transport system substrate-binding protein
MKRKTRCISFFLSFFFGVLFLPSQEKFRVIPEAETKFSDGLILYKEKKFLEAYAIFSNVYATFPLNQRTTASYVMASKSLFNNKEFERAAQTIETFFLHFPDSKFSDEARFLLAKCYVQHNQHLPAFRTYLSLIEDTCSMYRITALASSEKFAETKLSLPLLEQIAKNEQWKIANQYLLFYLLKKNASLGNISEATRLLDSLKKIPLESQLKKRVTQFSLAAEKIYRFAVLLPLSGASADIGKSVLEGIQSALREVQKNFYRNIRLELLVRDTKQEPFTASLKVEELARDSSVIGILGPLFTNECIAAAANAQQHAIPLLIPASPADTFSSFGSYIFQLTPSYETQGKAMASYVANELQLKNVVVLSANEQHAISSAKGFQKGTEQWEGNVLALEYFPSNTINLKEQMISILKTTKGKKIDALYVSLGTSEDIGIVMAQLKYYNIRGRVFGNGEWNQRSHLFLYKLDADGVTFSSDYFENEEQLRAIILTLKKRPQKFFTYGYDAFMTLYRQAEKTPSRKQIAEQLPFLQKFQNVHTSVIFQKKQTNRFIHILQFSNGEIKKIGEAVADEK